jgi:hypothetical protein
MTVFRKLQFTIKGLSFLKNTYIVIQMSSQNHHYNPKSRLSFLKSTYIVTVAKVIKNVILSGDHVSPYVKHQKQCGLSGETWTKRRISLQFLHFATVSHCHSEA